MPTNMVTITGSNSENRSEDHLSAKEHNKKLKQDLINKVNERNYDSEDKEPEEEEPSGKKFTKQISSNSGSKNNTTSALDEWKNKNRKNSGRTE